MRRVLVFLVIVGFTLAIPKPHQTQYRNLFKRRINGLDRKPSPHIVGGIEAPPHSIPYQAFLEMKHDGHVSYCGGSLISETFVLTAGHCAYLALGATAVLGAHKVLETEMEQVKIKASEIILHEGYDHEAMANDIALVRLSVAVTFTANIQPVLLPPSADLTFAGDVGKVSGWGYLTGFDTQLSKTLNYAEAVILSNEQCKKDFEVTESNICISGEADTGSCKGDSGGPLVVDNIQVGIVSYGIMFCLTGFPTVLTRVSSYLDWIEAKTQ